MFSKINLSPIAKGNKLVGLTTFSPIVDISLFTVRTIGFSLLVDGLSLTSIGLSDIKGSPSLNLTSKVKSMLIS